VRHVEKSEGGHSAQHWLSLPLAEAAGEGESHVYKAALREAVTSGEGYSQPNETLAGTETME
jgi:hypothetical protein